MLPGHFLLSGVISGQNISEETTLQIKTPVASTRYPAQPLWFPSYLKVYTLRPQKFVLVVYKKVK
jgi:hypothetical protein